MRKRTHAVTCILMLALLNAGQSVHAEQARSSKSQRLSEEKLIKRLPTPTFELQEITEDDLPKVEQECRRLSEEEGLPYQLVMGELEKFVIRRHEVEMCMPEKARYCEEVKKYATLQMTLYNSNLSVPERKISARLSGPFKELGLTRFNIGGRYAFCAKPWESQLPDRPLVFHNKPYQLRLYHVEFCFLCFFNFIL